MAPSGTRSTSASPELSSGGLITLLPFPSMLPFRHADDQPVERVGDLDLAGEARVRFGQRGETQHALFLRAGRRGARHREPCLLDIDMAGRAGALAAAIGVNTGDVVVD